MLTVATRNECHLCVAMHTAALARHGAAPELIDALRAGAERSAVQASAATRSSHSPSRASKSAGCSICRLWPATSSTANVARG